MADKRISQLVERTDIANNDVVPIVAFGASTTNKATISSIQSYMQENLDVGVTSIGLSMPSAFVVSNSPVTMSGNISVTGAGTVSQYIRGDGSLADFPQGGGGGGASVNYYLNGSVSQGTIGGIAFREMSKSPILGTGTDFVAIADGYLASFITDAGDPALLEIPAGNWNFETYFSASSGGGTPSFYVELYKVNSGGTATLIASNSGTPELIAFGTMITPYFSALAVPTTTLTLTDRLAIRYYVARSGRTITLHTENSHLCQIITTFTTGLTALNGLTAQVQNFTTGTSGTDFGISSTGSTHTFNLPDASATARGVVTTGIQTIAGIKNFTSTIRSAVSVEMAATGTALPTELKNINGPGLSSSGSNGIGFNSSNNLYFAGSEKGCAVISMTNTGTRTYTLQDTSGVIALTSNIPTNPLGGSGTINQIPKYTSSTTTLGNSNISDNGTDVGIASRTAISLGGQSIIFTPNLGGTTNRIETTGSLPLALVTGGALTFAAGGTTPQITLATTGAVTLTGALNGTSGSFNGLLSTTAGNGLLVGGSGFAFAPTATRGSAQIVGSTDRILAFGSNGNQDAYIYNSASVFQVVSTPSVSFAVGGVERFNINGSTGAANFIKSVTSGPTASGGLGGFIIANSETLTSRSWRMANDLQVFGDFGIEKSTTQTGSTYETQLYIGSTGRVGIGVVLPAARLEVKQSGSEIPMIIDSSSDAFGAYTQYQVNNSGGWETGMARAADSYSYLFSYGSFGTSTSKFTLTNTGNATFTGSVSASGLLASNDRLYMPGNQPISNWFSSSLSAGYSSSNGYGWVNGAGNLVLGVNGSERVRVTGDGLTFNGDTSAANALDDYEEGTWTPTSTAGGLPFNVQTARYTKVGRLVTLQAYIEMATGGTADNIIIGGAPFANSSQGWSTGSADLSRCAKVGAIVRIEGGGTQIQILVSSGSTTGDRIDLKGNDFGSNSYMIFTLTYQTS